MKLSDINLHSIGNTRQLVGMVFGGENQLLLCLFPDDQGEMICGQGDILFVQDENWDRESTHCPPEQKVRTLDMNLEEWEQFIRQTDWLETEVIAQASDGKLAKVVLRKSARQIEAKVSWAVFRRDKYACRYCGKDDVPLTIDHLVLWEEGGPSTVDNLLAACKKCNNTRGNMQYAEWLQSPEYRHTRRNLSEAVHQQNVALIPKLDGIPRRVHKKSR